MSIYLEKAMNFTERALPMLHENEDVHVITHKCPHCDGPVKFPLVVKEVDMIAFAKLLRIAKHVLGERGLTEAMLEEIFKKIKELQNKKPQQGEDGS